MRLRSVITLALAAWTLLAVARASAQESEADARARRHFESGTAYFEVGDYDSALRELQVAYDISHRPALLYNLYMTHERLGHFAEAAANLERYLAEEPELENRQTLEERLARLRERAAAARAAGESGDDDLADGAADRERTGATPQPAPSSGPPILTITGFTLAGVGLVLFAVGGGLVLSEDARLQGCTPICAPGEAATLDAATLVADVGLGATLLGGILGVIGLVLEGGSGEPSGGAAPARAGISVRGRSLVLAF